MEDFLEFWLEDIMRPEMTDPSYVDQSIFYNVRNGVTYNLEKMMSDIHRQEPSVVAQIIKASIISWCREAGR